MGVNKKLSTTKRKAKKSKVVESEIQIRSEEIMECIDELFIYFDITEDSFSEPPVIIVNDGLQYRQGLID